MIFLLISVGVPKLFRGALLHIYCSYLSVTFAGDGRQQELRH